MRVYIALGISLGIGLLIGLQRERTEPRLGGIRTFPLNALFGTSCGLLKRSISPPKNPAQLTSALVFGAIYAVALPGSAAVKQHFGRVGLYAVSAVSGLADLDAVAVATSRQLSTNGLDPNDAWRMFLIASPANLVFKTAAASILGGRRFAIAVSLLSGLAMAGGLAILILCPT